MQNKASTNGLVNCSRMLKQCGYWDISPQSIRIEVHKKVQIHIVIWKIIKVAFQIRGENELFSIRESCVITRGKLVSFLL